MLSPGWADIPFRRSVYEYAPGTNHWLDVAYPFYMISSTGAPIPSYGDPDQEMKTRIFDPGYYLDVLVRAIGIRVATLAAMEPAFRSTGYDRDNLRAIYTGLGDFIDKWNKSMLTTTVAGPLDTGFGKLSNPLVYQPNGIPMGAVDPVSGDCLSRTRLQRRLRTALPRLDRARARELGRVLDGREHPSGPAKRPCAPLAAAHRDLRQMRDPQAVRAASQHRPADHGQ
jgi:hypothetical protein